MRRLTMITVCIGIFATAACTFLQSKKEPPPPVVPKKIAVPIGKKWQVVEEPPALTNERNEQTLPFQKEQSVQPPGAPPQAPSQRKIETNR